MAPLAGPAGALAFAGDACERESVFLVHGLGRTARSMRKLERELERGGYEVHNLNLPSRRESIESLADRVSEAVRQSATPGDRISFVTHSLGGLVIRTYLSRQPAVNLGRVVMLAPPNRGSELADLLNAMPILRGIAGPTRRALGTHSSMPRLGRADFELGVIAGTRSFNPLSWFLIPGPDDGVVSVESTKLPDMADFITVRRSHGFIMNAPEVIAQTSWFLETGAFRHAVHGPASGNAPRDEHASPPGRPVTRLGSTAKPHGTTETDARHPVDRVLNCPSTFRGSFDARPRPSH
jgi:pimeloyl-ACP methyl ester carboxylesterase